ncbi:MAG: hypothetical protein HY866_21465 [Chloroflexi bacterium]|nr:hypothetical protein [Chloroflexota bacterium]
MVETGPFPVRPAVSPNGETIIVQMESGDIVELNVMTEATTKIAFPSTENTFSSILYAPDGIIMRQQGAVYWGSVENGRFRFMGSFAPEAQWVTDVAIDPNEHLLAAVVSDDTEVTV